MADALKPRADATVRVQIRTLMAMADAFPAGGRRALAADIALATLEWCRGHSDQPPVAVVKHVSEE